MRKRPFNAQIRHFGQDTVNMMSKYEHEMDIILTLDDQLELIPFALGSIYYGTNLDISTMYDAEAK